MNLQRARNVLWATGDVCQRIAELQDLCRALIEDTEKSDATISELKAELAKFHECDFDEDGMATACDGYGVNHHSVQVWHKEDE